MKTKESLSFFILVNKTLEFAEIKNFLSKHRYGVKVVKEVNDEFISELNSVGLDKSIVLIGFKKNSLFPQACTYISKIGKKTVYEELLCFLDLKPDDWQKLIILNQKEGMRGLQKACIRKEQICEIRNKVYTLEGISKKDLLSLEEDFASAKIKYGLYKIVVGKEKFKSAVIDRAIILSRGRTKDLDIWICFRDGSPSYFIGDGYIAYCLFDEFQGMYSGNEDWTGYKGREDVEKVGQYLDHLYAKKANEIKEKATAIAETSKVEEPADSQSFKVKKGKKRK